MKNYTFKEATYNLPSILYKFLDYINGPELLQQNPDSNVNNNTQVRDNNNNIDFANYLKHVERYGKYNLYELKNGEEFLDKNLVINDNEKVSNDPYFDDFVLISKNYREPILLYANDLKMMSNDNSFPFGFRYAEDGTEDGTKNSYTIKLSDLLVFIKNNYPHIENNLIVIDLTCATGISDRAARAVINGRGPPNRGGNKKNRKTKRKKIKRKKIKRKKIKRKKTKRKKQSVKNKA